MVFASREDAGKQLGLLLQRRGMRADTVLGLPRGGVIVAAEVARVLGLPLDVLIVRKVGHPLHREFAVGALAEHDITVLDKQAIGENPIIRHQLTEILQEERARLKAYQERFHPFGSLNLVSKAVLLVDDGLATGATTEAAVLSAEKQGAEKVVVATPVASTHAVERLEGTGAEVIALHIDPAFDAVGRYYEEFSQSTDEEVLSLLKVA